MVVWLSYNSEGPDPHRVSNEVTLRCLIRSFSGDLENTCMGKRSTETFSHRDLAVIQWSFFTVLYRFPGPTPGNIQDQVGQGSEHPDLVSGVPARCGGVGLDDL